MKLILYSFIANQFENCRAWKSWSSIYSETEISNEEFLFLKLKYNIRIGSTKEYCCICDSNMQLNVSLEREALTFLCTQSDT